jgi:dUTP pyrophosphatase
MKVAIVRPDEDWVLPNKATKESAGFDLCASKDFVIYGNKTQLVSTNLSIALDEGTVGFVCSRSGLALKSGVFVLNAPGIIDADYRGEVGVILHNSRSTEFYVSAGDRIAQLLIVPMALHQFIDVVPSLDSTDRGAGGFGSTGVR